jgi:hypothetical protein
MNKATIARPATGLASCVTLWQEQLPDRVRRLKPFVRCLKMYSAIPVE